jgi:IS30 family transposase
MNIVQEYYENYNFPGSEKLYRLLKKDGHNFKKKDIDDFLAKQKEHEMLKVKQVKKKQTGHITAFTYKENAQMDIFDISKYSKNNKNYKYLLVLIDVFTRKVFLRPLKNKNMDDVMNSLNDIFSEYIPHVITSDSDSSFMSNQLQALFDKNNIYHDVVIYNRSI